MDGLVHRVEALPGDGRYAVTFQRADSTEQTAVVQLHEVGFDVAEASLPPGWTRSGEPFEALLDALRSIARSRSSAAPAAGRLRDPDGGWDVSLGNVVLAAAGAADGGLPSCIAHGSMHGDGAGRWVCPECGAQALFGSS